MKHATRQAARWACLLVTALAALAASAQGQGQGQALASEPQGLLYAVEIKTGPAWDSVKPAQEQPHFREHSANLKRLRDQGSLVLGARYADKGLVVLQAGSEQEAHAMMQADLSIQNRVFAYELHDFNVFYGGTVQARRRRP